MTDFEEREKWFEDRGYCVIEEEKIKQATRELVWLRENNAELLGACQQAVEMFGDEPIGVMAAVIKKAVKNDEFFTK